MDDEEVVSENELECRGEITFFNGEPFNGACVDYYENGRPLGYEPNICFFPCNSRSIL